MNAVLAVDQSTQGTKALLVDETGKLIARSDRAHAQLIDRRGWVEHDPEELYRNTLGAVKDLLESSAADPVRILAAGISNQRETALAWDRKSGKPVCNAIVWQCARGESICRRIDAGDAAERIRSVTGLPLSPYFSAAKLAWILENVPGAKEKADTGNLCMGTVDSWLVYRLTGGKMFRTDSSNASRTQLFDITRLKWSPEICGLFGIPAGCLAEACDSDSLFGETDFEGLLPSPVPIHGMLGDSNAALFGQGCLLPGMVKATYGTGSSVMLNTGGRPVFSRDVATSLAWKMSGRTRYVLEGNINYTGAVIAWLKDGVGLIRSAKEAGKLAESADPDDHTYLVPAFTGLGAPYWASEAKALLYGMTRKTGRAEIVRAAEDCIAYQIADVLLCMKREAGIPITELRADGGPTADEYLMQFQSDLLDLPVLVPEVQELSGLGAAYVAGLSAGVFGREVLGRMNRRTYRRKMDRAERDRRYAGWKDAVGRALKP